MAVTVEMIHEKCDELAKQGKEVSNRIIHELVGGSYRNIAPAIRDWRSRQQLRPAPAAQAVPVPQAITDKVASLASDAWITATGLASEKIDRAIAEANEKITAANAERDETLLDVDAKQAELDAVKVERDQLDQNHKSATAELAEAQLEIARWGERITGEQQQVESLKKESEAIRGDLQGAQAEVAALTSELKHAQALHEKVAAELQSLRIVHQKTTVDLQVVTKDRDQIKDVVSEQKQDLLIADASLKKAISEVDKNLREVARLTDQLAAKEQQAKELKAELAAARTQAQSATNDAARLAGRIEQLEKQTPAKK